MKKASVVKLVKQGIDADIAEKLVTGGFATPQKIRKAKDKDLKDVGITTSELNKVKANKKIHRGK